MKRIGINVNTLRDEKGVYLKRILEVVDSAEADIKTEVYYDCHGIKAKELETLSLMIVLGGDGSILHTVPYIQGYPIPIMGVNIGHVGFLCSCDLDRFAYCFQEWLRGTAGRRQYRMLEMTSKEEKLLALNDIVIKAVHSQQLLNMNLYLNGKPYLQCRADGVIISTEAGSTAYSMSAGGPLLVSGGNNYCVTFICPYQMNFHSLVLDDEKRLEIEIINEDSVICFDGHEGSVKKGHEKIEIFLGKNQIECLEFL